jgi:hypothetical protein
VIEIIYADVIVPNRKNLKKLKRLINSTRTANTSFACGLQLADCGFIERKQVNEKEQAVEQIKTKKLR